MQRDAQSRVCDFLWWRGRIILTTGEPPTPWSFDSALKLSWCLWVCHQACKWKRGVLAAGPPGKSLLRRSWLQPFSSPHIHTQTTHTHTRLQLWTPTGTPLVGCWAEMGQKTASRTVPEQLTMWLYLCVKTPLKWATCKQSCAELRTRWHYPRLPSRVHTDPNAKFFPQNL